MKDYCKGGKFSTEEAIESSPLPGHIAIEINGRRLDSDDDIRCFGVKEVGAVTEGKGVVVAKVVEEGQDKKLLFSITKLTEQAQFCNQTKELVIKIGSREICRKEVISLPCSYF